MDKSEFQAQIQTLPPGMRFVVSHVLPLCTAVFVVFGALLIVVLAGHDKQRSVIAAFCVVAMTMAVANLAVFGVARRRMTRQSEAGGDAPG
jgi:Na+/melibiose symporter-like transporter